MRKESKDKKGDYIEEKIINDCVSHERIRLLLPTSAGISNRGG